MTNKEVLRRLKDCYINGYVSSNFTIDQDGNIVGTFELDYHTFLDLIKDIEKDAEYEDEIKLALNSIYGLGIAPNYSSQFAVYSKRDVESIKEYFTQHYQVDGKAFAGKAVVRHVNYPKVMFNGPCTIFQWGDFKTVVKCDEEDEFDVYIGLGIALYRYYRQNADTRKQFNKLAEYMFLYQLADYALDYFCGFSKKKKNGLFNNEPVNGWYRLDK